MLVLSGWDQIADNPRMTKAPDYRGYRSPREIIARAVWLYHRFTLSFRDVEDLLAERGIVVSYETIRQCRIAKTVMRTIVLKCLTSLLENKKGRCEASARTVKRSDF